MRFVKILLGTLLLALPILRSVSISSGIVEGSSDAIEVSSCNDGKPKWCKKMRIKFSDTFKRKCKMDGSKVQVKFCCETCKAVNNVTAEVEITTTTQKPVTIEKSTTQHLMYTMLGSQTIYSYTLDADRDPVKNGQFTIPFSTDFPSLAYNVQLNSFEIIGDRYSR